VSDSKAYSTYVFLRDCGMMKLFTSFKEQNIPIKIYRYDTFFKRLKGLMFRLKPIEKEGILIDPCNSIHMFFMFFSIDVVFLNEHMEIVAVKENVKPWTLIFPITNAKSTLELPEGTISKYYFQVGNKIEL
jgi:uncharacterized protein